MVHMVLEPSIIIVVEAFSPQDCYWPKVFVPVEVPVLVLLLVIVCVYMIASRVLWMDLFMKFRSKQICMYINVYIYTCLFI